MMKTSQPYALEQIVADIQRQWGHEAIQTLAHLRKQEEVVCIPFGVRELDAVLAGIPRQALTLLRGNPTAGTTRVAYCLLAEAQKQGNITVYVDCCHTFDGQYASQVCGVQLKRLLHIEPVDCLHGLAITRDFVSLPYQGLLILDMGLPDDQSGLSDRVLDNMLRTIYLLLKRSNWTLLLLLPTSLFPACNDKAAVTLSFVRAGWIKKRVQVRGYTAAVTIQTRHAPSNGQTVYVRVEHEEMPA